MRIKDWGKFQHFKDRRPPWIKLYREILDDLEWHKLDPVAAKCLVMLWLLASEDSGQLPDIAEIAFRLRITEKQVETTVSKLGHWLEQPDINMISERHQDDPLERETEREKETPSRTTKSKKQKLTPLPEDFCISPAVAAWAEKNGHRFLDVHLESFRLKAKSKNYEYADWDAAFMEAVRKNWAGIDPGVKPVRAVDPFAGAIG